MGEPIPGQNPINEPDIIVTPEDADRRVVKIEPEDIPEHLSKFHEANDKTTVLLDAEKDIWIDLGVPTKTESEGEVELAIPDVPHVFMAHQLTAIDDNHTQGVILENVPVIFAHGGRVNDKWIFGNGRGVVETVLAYDKLAAETEMPPLEFVISCNASDESSEIQAKDFLVDRPIVQAVDAKVGIFDAASVMDRKTGQIRAKVQAKDFWGLDELIAAKSVKLLENE